MSRKSVDLEQVKAARKSLKEIASQHPDLLGEKGPENVQGWESILAENEMGKTSLVHPASARPRRSRRTGGLAQAARLEPGAHLSATSPTMRSRACSRALRASICSLWSSVRLSSACTATIRIPFISVEVMVVGVPMVPMPSLPKAAKKSWAAGP